MAADAFQQDRFAVEKNLGSNDLNLTKTDFVCNPILQVGKGYFIKFGILRGPEAGCGIYNRFTLPE